MLENCFYFRELDSSQRKESSASHSCHGLFIMLGGSDAECKVKTLDGSLRAGRLQGAWGMRGGTCQHKVSLSVSSDIQQTK